MAIGLMKLTARDIFLRTLQSLQGGSLELVCRDETYHFGEPHHPLHAVIAVHHPRFFERALWAGDVGIGEAYMDGDWSTPDLVAVVRLAVRNMDHLDGSNRVLSGLRRMADWLAHRRNSNSLSGSRRNIAYHYDLGNDFYRLFLDSTLAYSSAYYETESDQLERAQLQKFDLICRKLRLEPRDTLLEIGTGWGGFAAYAAQHYGCRVTTTTISRQQHDVAQRLFSSIPAGERIELLFEDYRNLTGRFDKIVSIEMFEAVGFKYYDQFFGVCDRLLKPEGSMLLQTITIEENRFEQYLRQSDWIRKYIFPGAELASPVEIQRCLARSTRLQLMHLEDIGIHYALTLHEWRRRFLGQLDAVRQLGYDERFIRMWDYYLAYCEGAFRERYIGNVQLLLSKRNSQKRLHCEPAMDLAVGTTDAAGTQDDAREQPERTLALNH